MNTLKLIATIAVIGVATSWAVLAEGVTKQPLTTVGTDSEETSFGDLATDALCEAANTTIAMAPAVIFKSGEIAAGTVSKEAVSALLHDPAETWAVLELTGAQIKEALERSVSFAPTPRTFFLQVSGLTVVYNPDAPRNRKVKTISVGPAEISEAARYEVAMPASLADGGSGYFTIFGSSPRSRTGSSGLAEAIVGYVSSQSAVSYTGQGRIVIGG